MSPEMSYLNNRLSVYVLYPITYDLSEKHFRT